MSQNLKWKFEENQAAAIEGPAHPGMAHFTGDRETSIIREAIQNSLDAAEAPDGTGTVVVNFQHKMLDGDLLATDSLARHIQYAIDSPHNEEKYLPGFERAKDLLGGGGSPIESLCITDSNTTGATDIRHNNRPTFWETLTKGEGLTNKPQKDAAGSFGIGKFASFVATPLRTVLYNTAYLENGHLRQRFMGKAILVSHKGKSGTQYKRIGYLGNGFNSLKDAKVPDGLQLKKPGTAIHIPGYSFNDGLEEWEKRGIDIVLSNYFHAIIHGGLEVNVGDSKINANTYKHYLQDIEDKMVQNYIRVSLGKPVDRYSADDVGDISIRIEVNKETRNKKIALVRDAGMLITTDRKHIFPKLAMLPTHWWGFTAIIECKSKGEALLKQAESPRHDQISIDNISDEDLRKKAKGLFDEIGRWCYQVIKEIVEPDPGSDSESVDELAEFLPIEGDESQDTGHDNPNNQGDPVVTQPIQSLRAPWKPKKTRPKKEEKKPTETPGNGDVIPYRKGEKKGKKGEKRQANLQPQSFVGVRFRKGSNDAHSVIVAFEQPETTPTKIEMLSVGEDGTKYPMGIRKASVGGESLQVVDDNLFSLPDAEPGERREIEIFTREPVTDKTFSIRFFEE